MELKPWMQNLMPADMPNSELKELAEEFGIQSALEVISAWAGLIVSVPKQPFRDLLNKYIINNYDGTRASIVKLAKECEVTDRYIYYLLKKLKTAKNSSSI
ncbi:MAG TPA: Mor transcription activator family protein [Candidatus Gastranaerophilales bacterium]|nr:Mor transcription activator family protein [Candidatus Gastranaerophilales bacterium]